MQKALLMPALTNFGIEVVSLNLMLEEETQPVIWRGPVVSDVVKQFWGKALWKDIDVMFVDMPPGTGEVPLTVFQSVPLDGIVVVATPQELVGMIVEKAVNMAKMMEYPGSGTDREYELYQNVRTAEKRSVSLVTVILMKSQKNIRFRFLENFRLIRS